METLSLLGSSASLFVLLLAPFLFDVTPLSSYHYSGLLTVCLVIVGKTLLSHSRSELTITSNAFSKIYEKNKTDFKPLIEKIFELAQVSREGGILSLEKKLPEISEPLLKHSLKLVIDGASPDIVRELIDTAVRAHQKQSETTSLVLSSLAETSIEAGAFSILIAVPSLFSKFHEANLTAGIIASHLSGLVFGYALSILFFKPWSKKITLQSRESTLAQELIRLGVLSIQEGLSPSLLKGRLEVYLKTNQ